jgi:hypothetical protein
MGKLVYRHLRKRQGKVAKANPRLQHLWYGIDLRRELHRLIQFCPERLQVRPPSLVLDHRSKEPPNSVAWADLDRHQIKITLWPLCPPGWALASLVHELSHFVCDDDKHNEVFRTTMVELVRDGYGVKPAWTPERALLYLDRAVEDALTVWYRKRHGDEFMLEQLSMWLQRERHQRKRTQRRQK